MKLFARPNNHRTQRILVVAKVNELDVKVQCEDSNSDMYGKIPVLDTGKSGCIFASNAIGRYLARMRPDIGLYGQNFIESGEVDSWVEYSSWELEVPLCTWTFPMEGIFPEVTQATTQAQLDVEACLSVLNKHLTHRTFMVGENLTFADIHIASVLFKAWDVHHCLEPLTKDLMHLKRWYKLISKTPAFSSVFVSKPASKQDNREKKGDNKQQQQPKKEQPKQQPKKEQQKKEQPKKDDKKDEPKPAPSRADIIKKVVKEGGKRGVEIEGVSDMGGLNFFCTAVEQPKGDLEFTEMSVDAMNADSDPTEEERRGGSKNVGKMIFSDGEDLAIVCYVPEALQSKTTADVWMQNMLKTMGESSGYVAAKSNKTKAFALLKCDKEKGRFSIKLKDTGIGAANAYLREHGLFPDDDDDEDDMCFGDDDFPSM